LAQVQALGAGDSAELNRAGHHVLHGHMQAGSHG